MKKILSLILAVLVVVFSGCSLQGKTDNDRLNIVTTIFPQYDFARAVAGDKADITLLIKPGNEAHTYDPTPKETALISLADLFICTGSESEGWVETIADSASLGEEKRLTLFSICGGSVDEHGHELDEHVWTSPKNAVLITEGIRDRLCEIDPENKDYYSENAKTYIEKLESLDGEIEEIVKNGERKIIAFGDRFPARHFAERYSLSVVSAIPGCSADSSASSWDIAEVIDTVKKEEIPVVFYIEFSDGRTADIIAEATGAKKLLFHSLHNISTEDFENGKTYIDIMEVNKDNLKEALS